MRTPKRSIPTRATGAALARAARAGDQTRRRRAEGMALLERTYNPAGDPVVGYFIYTAYLELVRSLKSRKEYRAIRPGAIGTPAILAARPGISQIELAAYLGVERATAGKYVAYGIRHGLVRRELTAHDRRRFALFVTPKGLDALHQAVAAIPGHEEHFTRVLSKQERNTLRTLLRKLIMQ